MSELYVDCAIPVAVDKLFTYKVSKDLHDAAKPGVRVVVPFGNRTVVGFVIECSAKSKIPNPKSIIDVLDEESVISRQLVRLTQWMSEYYFAPLGEVIKTILVQGAAQAGRRIVTLESHDIESILKNLPSSSPKAAILRELAQRKALSTAQLQKRTGIKNIHAVIIALVHQGVVSVNEEHPKTRLKARIEQVIEINDGSRSQWNDWMMKIESSTVAKRAARQIETIRKLIGTKNGTVSVNDFLKSSGAKLTTLRTLVQKNVVTMSEREVIRSTEYDPYDSALGAQNIILNTHQQEALERISSAVASNSFHSFLLHGVTGSGKTQVYIEAIRSVLNLGKSAIVLVSEISLTPQIVRRFKHYFGEKVVALHSRMSIGERYDAWRLTREGTYSIVIGPRSAVFAPLKNLGLIVVDEEHESSYKQFDQTPRYHARDVAVVRASYSNAVVVLGSATPSLESYANTVSGKYSLLELPERIDTAQLPQIEIVDMTSERRRKLTAFRDERKAEFKEDAVKARESKRKIEIGSLSDLLKEKIEDRLKKNEGIILLQNRRGFSPFIECPNCGYVEMCDNCSISLTYHLTKRHLRCHYCGFVKPAPNVCPNCKGTEISYKGVGTQRVEEEVMKFFPHARLVRMDLDTTTRKGSHDVILKKFSEGEADILLGTQMVAKGLDFSRVTLVGVISADTQMLLPDFRSSERTFQLLTQVAGRAGRSALAGEVVIQTNQPQHESLKHVLIHDFKGFYDEEMSFRQELRYPPFSRIVLIEFKGKKEDEVMRHANTFSEFLRHGNSHFVVLGPAPASIARIKEFFRWHIVVKDVKIDDPSGKHLHQALIKAKNEYDKSALGKSKSVRMVIDVDPVGMM